MGHGFALVPGGKGANQAVAAARLGAQVRFAGCVGEDAFGALLRSGLAGEGIALDTLRRSAESPTGTAVILVADDGDNAIVVTSGANFAWDESDVAGLEDAVRESDIVIAQLEIPAWVVGGVFDFARKHGVRSVLDIGSDQVVPPGLLAKADVVSPNASETARLTGIDPSPPGEWRRGGISPDLPGAALAAARNLRGQGAPRVLLKLGARGSLWLDDEGVIIHRAIPITPVDTTAAGDAFTAAFGVTWGALPLKDALRYANAAGACAATQAGAQPAMPDRAAVARMLAHAATC